MALLLLSVGAKLSAQTSGTLSTQTSSNYSTAPWVITSGPGTYPDGGGVATFNEQVNNLFATPPAVPTITIDVPITLSGLTFNSVYQYVLATGAGGSLTFAPGGLTLNVVKSNVSSPTLFAAGDVISAVLAGSGGLTKSGAGIITLSGTNTYTGGTTINNGVLRTTVGDVAFGATGAGNDLTLNGGTLRVSTAALTTARNITLGQGGGTFELFANATVNGVVSGAGALTHTVGSTLALTGANTYTGATTQTAGTLTVSGASGTTATSSAYDIAGILTLDNATANNNNRISDTAAITSRGATINLTGNATAATAELAGALNLASGNSIITVAPNAAQQASINFASVNRQNNATLVVRGTNLGAAAGAGVAQVTATTAPTGLVGGGGAAGSTNISILPWAVGNTTSATATLGSSLVTYGATGFRPLAASEYAAAVGGSPTDNVRITAAVAAPAGTVNSLVFAPAAAATLSGGPITITSGAFLYSPTATATGTVSAGLNFGATEGLIHTSNVLNLSGVISGSAGVTYNAFAGSVVTVTGANTYTGATRINSGQLTFGGTIDAATAGPLGQTSAPIILNVGSLTTRLWVNADSIINRDISVQGNPSVFFTAGLGSTSNFNITLNGNLDLQRRVLIENGSLPYTINGVVSGPGSLSDAFASLVVLNGANTYSGGTEIQTGTYELGNNSALGTGTIFFSSTGTIRGGGTTARTIANNFVYNTATATFGGAAPLTFTGAQNLNGNRTFAVTNTAGTTFSGLVSDGAITKTGTGAMTLSNATGNTFTGGVTLGANAGALNVSNASGSGTGTGTVSIGGTDATTYSTLSGSFTIAGSTSIGGRLSPGNTPNAASSATVSSATTAGVGAIGNANFNGNLVFSGTSTGSSVLLEISALANFDRITVGGALTWAGTTVNFATINGFTVQAGNTFDFVDFSTASGPVNLTFNGLNFAPGVSFDTSRFLTDGVLTAVPEPGTWAMVGVGALALAGVQMRRRRR